MDTPTKSTGQEIVGLTVLRVVTGIIMTAHGIDKLTNMQAWQNNVASLGIPVPEVSSYLAVAGELLGGLGLIVGLFTPVAAFGVLCVLVTAILSVHLGNGLFARNDGWEFPLTLACVALWFLLRGAGPVSLDAAIRTYRQRSHREPPGEFTAPAQGSATGAPTRP